MRAASGGAKLPTLNPFSDVLEFAGGKLETLPGCLSRITFNQICTIPGQNLNRNPINLMFRVVTSAFLI